MKKKYFSFGKSAVAAAALSMAFLASCDSDQVIESAEISSAKDAQAMAGHDHVANEVLVKFKAGTSESAKAAVLERISGKVKERILTRTMQRLGDNEGLVLVHTPMAALEAMGKVKGSSEVDYVEPNYI